MFKARLNGERGTLDSVGHGGVSADEDISALPRGAGGE